MDCVSFHFIFVIQQGVPGALMRPALTKTLISWLWYRWGRSSTYLLIFMSIFCNGTWLTQEPPCRFQTTCFQFCRVARFSQSVKVGTIWLCWKGRVSFQHISSSSGYGDGNFSILLGSFRRPIPVRYNWNVFARKMHSTAKFAMIVLSKCVIHAGFLMVAWTLRGRPFQLGIWILDLISEFTIFNLVICLSKVKESFSPIGRMSVETACRRTGRHHFA